jgi:hypothetical protein
MSLIIKQRVLLPKWQTNLYCNDILSPLLFVVESLLLYWLLKSEEMIRSALPFMMHQDLAQESLKLNTKKIEYKYLDLS